MTQETTAFVTEKLNDLLAAPMACAEVKEAAKSWLEAVDTNREAEETKRLIAELEADIIPIDGLIAFSASDAGVQVLGEEKAKEIHAHAKEIKEKGALWCDCPACTAVAAILDKKEAMLS